MATAPVQPEDTAANNHAKDKRIGAANFHAPHGIESGEMHYMVSNDHTAVFYLAYASFFLAATPFVPGVVGLARRVHPTHPTAAFWGWILSLNGLRRVWGTGRRRLHDLGGRKAGHATRMGLRRFAKTAEQSICVNGHGVTDSSGREASDGEVTAGMPDSSVKLREIVNARRHRDGDGRQAFCGRPPNFGLVIAVTAE